MDKLNTDNIKNRTSQLIAYDNFKRKEHMKNKKLLKISYVIGVFAILIGGTISVNALTDNSISDSIKKNLIKVFVDDKEVVSDCVNNNDGTLTCKVNSENNPDEEIYYTVYDGNKDIKIDNSKEE